MNPTNLIDSEMVAPQSIWVDDRGYFMEAARLGQGLFSAFPGETKQVNCALTFQGAIKLFHFHRHQTDFCNVVIRAVGRWNSVLGEAVHQAVALGWLFMREHPQSRPSDEVSEPMLKCTSSTRLAHNHRRGDLSAVQT